MSGDGRSPRSQRRSYSPASPPVTKDHVRFVQSPQTPPPSVHMSPSWQTQPIPSQQQEDSAPGSVSCPTPPTMAGLVGTVAVIAKDEADGESGEETPVAKRATEREGKHRRDIEDDDHAEERGPKRFKVDEPSPAEKEDAEHRRTDHERQEEKDTVSALPKALRSYRPSTDPIAPVRPQYSDDVIALYGLSSLQASVARRDEQGNKINKLRRSYEGKVKALGLEGKPKARVNEEGPILLGLLDPNWDAVLPDGSTWWDAHKAELPIDQLKANQDIVERLDSATRLRPGRLPKEENDKWVDRVGLDESVINRASLVQSVAKPVVLNPLLARTGAAHLLRASAPASPRNMGARPERAGKKRRYDESSYTGYEEGYEDDGYSTGGVDDAGRRRSGAKKQKRQDFGAAASTPPVKSANAVGV